MILCILISYAGGSLILDHVNNGLHPELRVQSDI